MVSQVRWGCIIPEEAREKKKERLGKNLFLKRCFVQICSTINFFKEWCPFDKLLGKGGGCWDRAACEQRRTASHPPWAGDYQRCFISTCSQVIHGHPVPAPQCAPRLVWSHFCYTLFSCLQAAALKSFQKTKKHPSGVTGFIFLDPGEHREKAKELAAARGLQCCWPGAGLSPQPCSAALLHCFVTKKPEKILSQTPQLWDRWRICLSASELPELQTLGDISVRADRASIWFIF